MNQLIPSLIGVIASGVLFYIGFGKIRGFEGAAYVYLAVFIFIFFFLSLVIVTKKKVVM